MKNLVPVEYKKQRILITAQLAKAYGTEEKRISENFTRNQARYVEGKHFFLLQGEALKEFKEAYPQIADTLKFTSILYLWTEKGAWLHAKSLNTDKAWEAYEMLVDEYYRLIDVDQKSGTKHVPAWDRIAIGEIRFAKEFAKAVGIRPERAVAVALARIEKETGKQLADYRRELPAVEKQDAELLTPSQIGAQFNLKANRVNLLLEEMGLQYGIREAGKTKERLVKRNPWRLTEKGKEFGIMQDSSKQTTSGKWEGFQILWSEKAVDAVKDFLAQKGSAEINGDPADSADKENGEYPLN
ncbi:ORF6N domain protein [Peptococcaceae bacterium CEB3]|nr:ORF6N domain protein [Peptococcaceae bacterium CEB3]